jgi:hypothetical protein
MTMPGGVGYDATVTDQSMPPEAMPTPAEAPEDLSLPAAGDQPGSGDPVEPMTPDSASYLSPGSSYADQTPGPQFTAPRPYSPPRQPVFTRNTSRPNNPQPNATPASAEAGQTGLIGPVGYDPE